MNKFCIVLIVFSLICSCCGIENEIKRTTDDTGVVIATPYLWKTSLHRKEPMSNSFIIFSIIYNDNVLVPTTNGEESRALSLINSKDGKILWNWDDLYEDHSKYTTVSSHYQYQNLLTYQCGGRSYCINMDTGSTHWKIRRDRSFDHRIHPFGQHYFICGPDTIDENGDEFENYTFIAFKAAIQTGEISETLSANFSYECPECVRWNNFINQVPNKNNLLLVSYSEFLEDWIAQPYFGLYDYNLKEWIWDKVLITPPSRYSIIDWPSIIENNKIYAVVGNSIVCHDLATGEQFWKRDFNGDFLFSGFIVEDGKVIANCEDCYAYGLDAETGNILWSVRTAGTSTRLSYLNGIVYFVGGSVRRLFAIEADTGKIVWKIDPHLLGEDYDAGFKQNAVYVLPAKGGQPAKVIALSDMYAYCFEAYR